MLSYYIGVACLVWYIAVVAICTLGYVQIYRHYRNCPSPSRASNFPLAEVPHVTVIRPVRGLEPRLYECLASTFLQDYPRQRLTIFFCVAARDDPAVPILEALVRDFKSFDAVILYESEDPRHDLEQASSLGPNPKIRNMSRAYREAKGDLIWVIDCNVWVSRGVCGRMVDKLCGFGNDGEAAKPYKFVHQLPLVIDITNDLADDEYSSLVGGPVASTSTETYSTVPYDDTQSSEAFLRSRFAGGRLEELFLSSAHAKFYVAINTVLIAPCIVGKSNMFRRSHLNELTSSGTENAACGIDYFSYNICEDHLIGDLLWKKQVLAEEGPLKQTFGKHAILFGDLAIQPMARMSITEYIARRVRWLRVRKFTVTLATLVEPGTESFLCSFYGSVALTTIPWFRSHVHLGPWWIAFLVIWLVSVLAWMLVDGTLYILLHSLRAVEVDNLTPSFARCKFGSRQGRNFREWLAAWIGREALALPIWLWAFWGGTSVTWRGQKFRVGMDMRVHSIGAKVGTGNAAPYPDTPPNGQGKARIA